MKSWIFQLSLLLSAVTPHPGAASKPALAPASTPAHAKTSDSTPAPKATPAATWPDTVTLKTGIEVRCRIVTATTTSVLIEHPRRHLGQGPPMTREVPWSGIKSAEFSMDAAFRALLKATDPVKDVPRAAARWTQLMPLLGRPHHPAGALGLALARLSVRHPSPQIRLQGIITCQSLAAGDWDASRRDDARLIKAQLLMSLGRSEEAVIEARQLTQDPQISAPAAVAAHLLLAHTDFNALKKLDEENPLWLEDDTIRPEREALFHQTLETALKPSLFYGSLEEDAADGLWLAIEVMAFDRSLPDAAHRARDLIHLYPNSPRAAQARRFLEQHHLALDTEAQPDEPPATTGTATAGASPPPSPTGGEPPVQRRARYADPVTLTQPTTSPPPP
jgi:hypothetical protein